MSQHLLPVVILISGNGSNLQAIIDATKRGLAIDICAVISNRREAYGLERAKRANIPTHVIDHTDFGSRADFETTLKKTIDVYHPALIVLAGFMRKLSPAFVLPYLGKMINIHPSLLPHYPGLHTHARVLAAGDQEHGISIHYVTPEIDSGPIICQSSLRITPEDTIETLDHRIHRIEHVIYPHILSWFADGRLALHDHRVFFDNAPLPLSGKHIDATLISSTKEKQASKQKTGQANKLSLQKTGKANQSSLPEREK